MFKKLLSNLPFNPSLLDQVSFYSRRLQLESGVRRLGFALMALSLFVHMAAVLYPSQNSLAASPNDVLNGITTKNSILRAWDSNAGNIRGIYGKFGITRDNIAAIPGQQPNSTVVSNSHNWWSTGRLPLSNFGISGARWGERSIKIGDRIIYQRPLQAWDSGGSSRYAAFHGKNRYGVDFWILQNCGNPTFKTPYLPAPPKPKLVVHKTLLTKSVVQPGDIVRFRLEYRNTVRDSLATDFRLTDTLNDNFEYKSLSGITKRDGQTLIITRGGQLGFSANPHVSILEVKVKSSAKNKSTICNIARVSSKQSSAASERPCVTVDIPKAPPPPGGYCVASSSFSPGSKNIFIVKTQAHVEGGTKVTGYHYDVGGDGTIDFREPSTSTTHEKTFSNLGPGIHTVLVYVQLLGVGGQSSQTAACQAQITIAEEPRVILSKSVSNITQNKTDANKTLVKPGDVLEFKMKTENVTSSDYLNFNGEDYFGSVLQYADLADSSELEKQGLVMDSEKYLRWTIPKLAAGQSDVKTITVRVKSKIPSTNSPSTLSPDYNCTISNNFGNEVTMNVDCPLVKTVAQTATSLPNTGPGATMSVAVAVTVFAGYFFARSRIMAKELEAVRSEYVSSGGL